MRAALIDNAIRLVMLARAVARRCLVPLRVRRVAIRRHGALLGTTVLGVVRVYVFGVLVAEIQKTSPWE